MRCCKSIAALRLRFSSLFPVNRCWSVANFPPEACHQHNVSQSNLIQRNWQWIIRISGHSSKRQVAGKSCATRKNPSNPRELTAISNRITRFWKPTSWNAVALKTSRKWPTVILSSHNSKFPTDLLSCQWLFHWRISNTSITEPIWPKPTISL